jgi:dihydroflavonol-4-reductase
MKGCEVVYHTAALVSFARKIEREQTRVNVEGTRAVVEACLSSGVGTLVHASSVTTIGYPPPGHPATEETPIDRTSARGYKLSKLLAEDEIAGGVARGLRAVIVNPSVIMGERDAGLHGGQLVLDSARGRLLFYLDGGMNIVYSGDVAEGMIAAAERGETGERYILAGDNMTHRDIFTMIAGVTGSRPPLAKLPLGVLRGLGQAVETVSTLLGITPPLTADIAAIAGRFNWYSSKKAGRVLGFATIPPEESIRAAYEWYAENGYLRPRLKTTYK